MSRLTPCLWFDGNAEEAMNFYLSVFPDGQVVEVMPGPGGAPTGLTFEVAGQRLMALNGGPQFQFTPAISLFVACETQEEVDRYWAALSAGGEAQQCGWLTDRFGVSWQVVPKALGRLLGDPDRERAGRAMQAMLQMTKLDIAALERAAAGG